MSGDKTLSLQSTITQLGLTTPYIATPEYGTNLMSNQYEARDFVLVNSFKTTGDKVENGINTASTSAPIEIDLTFSQATSNKQLITFVEQANTLYIKNDGISSMVKGQLNESFWKAVPSITYDMSSSAEARRVCSGS